LLTHGERVIAIDDRLSWEVLPQEFTDCPHFQFFSTEEFIGKYPGSVEECIASPGIFPDHPVFRFLEERGIPVVSEIEFATRHLSFPLIGITGSCGKSTTVSLTGHLLKEAGYNVFVGGNLGTSLIESVASQKQWEWGVVELSSFQLERTYSARFHIAALLNLFPNHLDYHVTMERYYRAKARIFAHQKKGDIAIVNVTQNEWQTRVISGLKASILPVAVGKRLREGLYVSQGVIREAGVPEQTVVPIRELPLIGRHNWENVLVAVAIARSTGIPQETIARALSTFRGLPHRLEWIGCIHGVHYIDDSKSTTPSSTRRAIEALPGPLILILGGKAKIRDFSELRDVLDTPKVKAIIVYGEARQLLAHFIPPRRLSHFVPTLKEAVEVVRNIAQSGDVVLLSPACTSWDQYRDFTERGWHFRKLVLSDE